MDYLLETKSSFFLIRMCNALSINSGSLKGSSAVILTMISALKNLAVSKNLFKTSLSLPLKNFFFFAHLIKLSSFSELVVARISF